MRSFAGLVGWGNATIIIVMPRKFPEPNSESRDPKCTDVHPKRPHRSLSANRKIHASISHKTPGESISIVCPPTNRSTSLGTRHHESPNQVPAFVPRPSRRLVPTSRRAQLRVHCRMQPGSDSNVPTGLREREPLGEHHSPQQRRQGAAVGHLDHPQRYHRLQRDQDHRQCGTHLPARGDPRQQRWCHLPVRHGKEHRRDLHHGQVHRVRNALL